MAVGAFIDGAVRDTIGAPGNEHPLYIMPVGVVERLHELSLGDLEAYYRAHGRP